jgi:hypothetical protein
MRNIINRRGEELLVAGIYEVDLQTIYLIDCGGCNIAWGTYTESKSFMHVSNYSMSIRDIIQSLEIMMISHNELILENQNKLLKENINNEEVKLYESIISHSKKNLELDEKIIKDLKNWLSLKIEKMQKDGVNRYYYEDEKGECQEYISPELIELYKQNAIT